MGQSLQQGMFSLNPQMIQQAQQQQQFNNAATQFGGQGMFSPMGMEGSMFAGKLGQSFGSNPQMKKAQDFQKIKQMASQQATPGTKEYLAIVRDQLTQAGYTEDAAGIQQQIQKLEESELGASETQQKMAERSLDIAQKSRELGNKPVVNFGDEIEALSKAMSGGKFYEQLTPEQQEKVLAARDAKRIRERMAGRSSVSLTTKMGDDVFDFVKNVNGDSVVKKYNEQLMATSQAFDLVKLGLEDNNALAEKGLQKKLAAAFESGKLSDLDVTMFGNQGDLYTRVKSAATSVIAGGNYIESQLRDAAKLLDILEKNAKKGKLAKIKEYSQGYPKGDPRWELYNQTKEEYDRLIKPSAPKANATQIPEGVDPFLWNSMTEDEKQQFMSLGE